MRARAGLCWICCADECMGDPLHDNCLDSEVGFKEGIATCTTSGALEALG